MSTRFLLDSDFIPVYPFNDFDAYVDINTGEIYGMHGDDMPPGIYTVYRDWDHSWALCDHDDYTQYYDDTVELITVSDPQ